MCVAAHRGGHGQAPLQLSVLGLMLGHVLRRPHAAVLAALVPRFSGIALPPRMNQLSEGERRLRLQAADLAACNAVRQRSQALQSSRLLQPRAVQAAAPCTLRVPGYRSKHRSMYAPQVLQRLLLKVERRVAEDAVP